MSASTPGPRCVLLTNDDGPPDPSESPYVFGLYRYLSRNLGWNVKVVLPSSQKSWIGKAYHIKEIARGNYFYPREPDGQGEISPVSRPLKDNEVAEWILLDGTPATCANIALHNTYPNMIDLVISGPNLGRNSSSAFALSSGTIGAAMSSSLSKVRSIAMSYGTVLYPTPETLFEPAHSLAINIINHLWQNWGADEAGLRGAEIDLYNVNIPLNMDLLTDNGLPIYWTTMWRNSYGSLFQQVQTSDTRNPACPDAVASNSKPIKDVSGIPVGGLAFKFSPQMEDLIHPPPSSLTIGSDGWAIHKGAVSVTPLRASFAEPPQELDEEDVDKRRWKMKL
ncbi:sure-like protein [Marasmius fiardii PR-910]|nr:sure-like protein [Marasmius fiardii PR-910]